MSVLHTGVLVSVVVLGFAARGESQDTPWVVDVTVGYAGFVDDATKNTFVVGGAIRKYLTPRLSIGPEFVLFEGGDVTREWAMMSTGNVTFDAYPLHGPDARQITPFVVGGLGRYWARDRFATGPFTSSDPAFTAGGGVKGRVGDRISVAGEYRIGWELHQRLTGSMTLELR